MNIFCIWGLSVLLAVLTSGGETQQDQEVKQ